MSLGSTVGGEKFCIKVNRVLRFRLFMIGLKHIISGILRGNVKLHRCSSDVVGPHN